MAVVVNEFEVVSAPTQPPEAPPGAADAAPDPAKAEEELARVMRHLQQRKARLHAC